MGFYSSCQNLRATSVVQRKRRTHNIKNNSRKPPKYKPPLKILNGGLRLLFVDRRRFWCYAFIVD